MKEHVESRLKSITKHESVFIADRGNSAIFIAMHIASKLSERKKILIPDQGGWFSYKKFPHFFGLDIVEVKTKQGVIDLEDLQTKVNDSCAFIFSSFAGYFAEQPLKEISKICQEKNCLVIEDATGAIGDDVLCDGNYSDIIVGSFGRWKPVNAGYGGFISVKEKKWLDLVQESLSLVKVFPESYEQIAQALGKNKLPKLLALQKQVKNELREFTILHKDKRGVNVVVLSDPKVIAYCKEKNYPYVQCPKYIRVHEDAISIELKRLDL